MQTFFVNVLIAVFNDPKVQALLKQLFAEALDELHGDITANLQQLEAALVTSMEALPGEILGDATKNVGTLLHEITGTTDDIAGAVKGEVQPLLPTVDSIQSAFLNVIKQLPGGSLLGGIFGH